MDWSPQALINSGMAWTLEGSVGRMCMSYIEAGLAILGPEGVRDYWGNYVPSRTEVRPGTKGSIRYANRTLTRVNADRDDWTRRYRGKDFDSGLVLAREQGDKE